MILAIDPSSTCTGWAVAADDGTIIAHGRLKPKGREPYDRVDAMCAELSEIIETHRPSVAVIEEPSAFARKGNPFPYAIAYGRIYQTVQQELTNVIRVHANQWTGGRRKDARADRIKQIVPSYSGKGDGGHDEADAIGIALWATSSAGRVRAEDAASR